jgi:Flp pilus assembly protein TadG
MTKPRSRRWAARPRPFLREDAGVSAVEFALLSPLFCLVFAGAVDLGGALYTQSQLNAAVSAGANYAIVNAAKVESTDGGALASSIASLISSTQATNWANSSVIVNNGPTATITGAGGSGTPTTSTGGTTSQADSCWCPTYGSSGVSYGAATSCGSTCADGNLAGKFVAVSANRTYVPFFPVYNLIRSNVVASNMVVQVK